MFKFNATITNLDIEVTNFSNRVIPFPLRSKLVMVSYHLLRDQSSEYIGTKYNEALVSHPRRVFNTL